MTFASRFAMLVTALLAACHGHEHGGAGHDDHTDHGPEVPAVVFTQHTPAFEWFVEHPAFIVGQASTFAAHLTTQRGHDPVGEGAMTATLRQADGTTIVAKVDQPARAGIFRPAITPTVPGPCQLTLAYAHSTPDQVTRSECQVFAVQADIPPEGEEAAGAISYLKEQAWLVDFEVAAVAARPLRAALRVTGHVRPAAGLEARLTAPIDGRVQLAGPTVAIGASLAKGAAVATVVPSASAGGSREEMAASTRAGRAEVAAALADVARAQRLFDAGAIAGKQLADAKTRLDVTRAQLAGAQGRLGSYDASASGRGGGAGAFAIRAPIDGTLASVDAFSGQAVRAGDPIATLVDARRVWLQADVYEDDLVVADTAATGRFRVDGVDGLIELDASSARVVSRGRLVDPRTRTVPIVFELATPPTGLRLGAYATVYLDVGDAAPALAVPETAVISDGGVDVVYVQTEGESYERRVVTLGRRAGGLVELARGVVADEIVVTRGAYQVKLASAGGAVPAHGHAH